MIKELLSPGSGVSTMRLMSLISLVWGCILSGYGLYTGRDLTGLTALCSVFIGAAFAGKVGQKMAEKKDS